MSVKKNILNYKYDKYSTCGNDGIIEYIFKELAVNTGFFVEFGAWDGIKGSNCRRLYEYGWSGLFIESNKNKFDYLQQNYKKDKNIRCVNIAVGFSGNNLFDNILENTYKKVPQIAFCSIDIDGLDLEIFETIIKHLPIVVCIEGGQVLHPFYKRVPKIIAKYNIQQSLQVMNSVFESKGYKLLCSYQDAFFIKKEFFTFFNVSKSLLEQYYNGLLAIPRRIPYIQQCLDTVKLTNSIIINILQQTNYKSYGFDRRKEWIIKEYDKVIQIIKNLYKEDLKKC